MAKKNNNLLIIDLDDENTRDIANTISSKNCTKILNYITENEASEEEISEKLDIPISTVHYNLKQLIKANLIVADKYRYSKKGKEIKIYSPANKFIIIAPKGKPKESFLEQIKNIVPSFFIIGLGALFTYLITKPKEFIYEESAFLSAKVADDPGLLLKGRAFDTGLQNTAYEPINTFWYNLIHSNYFWFFVGVVVGIGVYFLVKYLRKKIKNKRNRRK